MSTQSADITLAGAVVGAVAAMATLGASALPYALTVLLLVAAWRVFRASKQSDALTKGLVAHWLELPGALRHGDLVHVHDGEHPLWVALGHQKGVLTCRIGTLVGDLPMAFRCWRTHSPKPPLRTDGAWISEPQLSREPIVEGILGGRMEVATNDPVRMRTLFDQDLVAATLSLSNRYPEGFDALTYDGKFLTLHLRGPLVADPEQATKAARIIWRCFI